MTKRILAAATLAVCMAAALSAAAVAQEPLFETRKITDTVYLFRYGTHQAMFVATAEGVIATDPIGYLRPEAVQAYLAEIRRVTPAPIRYVVYSHHHYDHIAGGQPFREQGAVFIAHRKAKARLEELRHPDVVIPDVGVDNLYLIELGGVRLELHYVGRNHSDNSLVMLLPKERLLFTVDFIPIETLQFRDLPDGYLPDWFDSLDRVLALDWDRMIPGHPYAGGHLGTKDDVANLKQYMTDLSAAVQQAAAEGKCYDRAMQEIKLPKYEKWGNYDRFLPGNIERFCEYWGRGY